MRKLINDNNRGRYAISDDFILRTLDHCVQAVAAHVGIGLVSQTVNITNNGTGDYDLSALQYATIHSIERSDGTPLIKRTFAQLEENWLGVPSGNGPPEEWAPREVPQTALAAEKLIIRTRPVTSVPDTLKVWYTEVPDLYTNGADDTVPIPFSRIAVVALENMLAARCLRKMTAEQRSERLIADGFVDDCAESAREALQLEKERRSRIKAQGRMALSGW